MNRARALIGLGLMVAGALTLLAWRSPRRGAPAEGGREAARRAVGVGNWEEAERLLRDWTGRNPDDGDAWLGLGNVLGRLGRDAAASEALGRVRPDDPKFGEARVLIGDLALKNGDARAAESAYRSAVDHDPKAVAPRAKLLGLLFVEWRKGEARGLLRELYRLTGDSRHLVAWTGLSLEESQPQQLRDLGGEIVRLEEELSRFLKRSPEDPLLRRARGVLRQEQGRPAEAIDDLEFAAERLTDDPEGRLALGDCRIALGNTTRLAEGIGPAPESPTLLGRWWLLKGQAEAAEGRTDAAIADWREAVAADPQSRAAHYQLGRALAGRGELDDARPALERAKAIRDRTEAIKRVVNEPEEAIKDAGAAETVARTLLDAGLTAEAQGWFEQALRLDPIRREPQLALAALGAISPRPAPTPRLRTGPAKAATSVHAVTFPEVDIGPRFEDVAAKAGLNFRYEPGARGDLFIADTMGGGVGLIDFDNDGWLDVYLVNGCELPVDPKAPPAPNKLFRNNRDGTFADATERAGVGGVGYGMGCAVGDYDGDGDDDLFVTGLGATVLYRNDGDGTFTDATRAAGVFSDRWTTAAGFADLDADGDLDLVVVTYVDANPKTTPPCHDAAGKPIHCPPGKFPAQVDHLFRNDGNGAFTDVAGEAGLEVPDGRGLGMAVADFDGDGLLDIYVANDAVPDFLFRNLGGLKFEEVGAASGAAYNGDGLATASMGVAADDLDGGPDGRVDLFHTNFRNEANTLLRNLGDGLFADATAAAGLDGPSRPVTGFGAAAFDADNDGHLDLFAANGHVDDQPWLGQPMAQPPHLYRGSPGGRFFLSQAGPYFAGTFVGRGAAAGDLDNDGRVDLVVVHRDAPTALLRNVSTGGGHWLSLTLKGGRSGTIPVGARVACRAGGRTVVRFQTAGSGYLSSHDSRIHLGLGQSDRVETLEVRWPSGLVQTWADVAADRMLEAREGREPLRAR